MGSEKKNRKQKSLAKVSNAGTSSETVMVRPRPKRKTTENLPEKKKIATIVSENKNGHIKESTMKISDNSLNSSILHFLYNTSLGKRPSLISQKFHKTCIINHLSKHKVFTTLNPFERRVTAIAWHPKYPQIVAAGSKGGELSLYNLNKSGSSFCPGIGSGGSIVGLKFNLDDPCLVYTSSISGYIKQEDFNGKNGITFLTIGCYENWFSSLDVCYDRKLLMAGDTVGNVYLLTKDGHKVWPKIKRFHKGKVTHVEFSPFDPNVFVTASIDHTVKLWDLRMISDSETKPSPTRDFPHRKGVNSAYFSPSNQYSLLTTDQHSEIRVYKSPMWDEELVIKHPHRQFQHLTPIKATWHPIEDIVVVGRYPDNNFKPKDERTIDLFDGSTGDLLHKFKSPTGGIITLNVFNATGDYMASGSGCNLIFMTDEHVFDGANFPKSAFTQRRVVRSTDS